MEANSGILAADLDPAISPAGDLYRSINGRWISRTEIPADKARYGSFIELDEKAEAALRAIVERAQSAPAGSE